MQYRDIPESPNRWFTQLSVFIIALCCLALVGWLKVPGLVFALIIACSVLLMINRRPDRQEAEAIKGSIRLSAEDIASTLNEFDHFVSSGHPDALADRTLTRPALLDKDCVEPRIEKFHFLYASNVRFLHRLDGKLATQLTVSQAESMLAVTDKRAMDLQESWIVARRAALELGPDYRSA